MLGSISIPGAGLDAWDLVLAAYDANAAFFGEWWRPGVPLLLAVAFCFALGRGVLALWVLAIGVLLLMFLYASLGLWLVAGASLLFFAKGRAVKFLLPLTVALALSGCALTQVARDLRDDPAADFFDVVRKVAIEDLRAAFLDAEAHNDEIGGICYAMLIKYARKERAEFEVKGPFSALQRARDLRAQIAGGIPTDLRLACSALLLDTRNFILKMGALSRGVTIP